MAYTATGIQVHRYVDHPQDIVNGKKFQVGCYNNRYHHFIEFTLGMHSLLERFVRTMGVKDAYDLVQM